MRTVSRVGLLPVIGLLCWCVFGTLGLTGCGGSGGGGDRAAAARSVSPCRLLPLAQHARWPRNAVRRLPGSARPLTQM